MKFMTFLAVLALMTSCRASPVEERYSHQIINSFAKQQKTTKGLIVRSTGGSIPEKIESLYIGFGSNNKLQLNDARRLYVRVVQEFIDKVNNDERLIPYAANWPFNENNADITLSFNEGYYVRVQPPYICLIFMIDGMIYYEQYNVSTDQLMTFHQEPFAEAVRIVNESSCAE